MKKKVLFIDRDGTLVIEPPVDYQLDAYEKLEFYPKVMRNLGFIRSKLDFEFVMVTNQDGLGTDSFPEETFWPVHNLKDGNNNIERKYFETKADAIKYAKDLCLENSRYIVKVFERTDSYENRGFTKLPRASRCRTVTRRS